MPAFKAPAPETLTAWLISEGIERVTYTLHRYVGAKKCVLPTPDGECWEYRFKCDQTGVERRWGTAGFDIPTVN